MIKYTIGIYFNEYLSEVLLIKKSKSKWQEGKFNFPGGKMEIVSNPIGLGDYDKHKSKYESPNDCVSREFKEECDLDVLPIEWSHIGRIEGNDYEVEVLSAIKNVSHGVAKSMEIEPISWHKIDVSKDTIDNVQWLIRFAHDFHVSRSGLKFGIFKYK